MTGLLELDVMEESEDGHKDESRKKSYADDGMMMIKLGGISCVLCVVIGV